MPKLVLVEGRTGSGKSSVTEYLESRGYARHSFDDYLSVLAQSAGLKTGDVIELASYNGSWDCRVSVENVRELLQRAGTLTSEERDILTSTMKTRYVNGISTSLMVGKDVAADAFVGKKTRAAILGTELADQKYLVRLEANPEVAIQRKMKQRGWDRDHATKRVMRELDYSIPDISGLVVLVPYDNNTPEDLERIKNELKRSLVL